MSIQDNKQVVADFFRAINELRLEDLPKYMAADVVDHNKIIYGEPDEPGAAFEGFRQQLAAFGQGIEEGAGTYGMFPEEFTAEDDRVSVRVTIRGIHTGYHPRMPVPTGRSCEVESVWTLTVTDGKISEIRGVTDRLGMFLQLGWDWPTLD
ncbi:ester cyclase [Streptomyces sp. NRRL B-1568]|nr:ester cyclase [Streptomyces sp. NRRL B-1568]